jgi:hypothetical protein
LQVWECGFENNADFHSISLSRSKANPQSAF